jgi:DNA repair protein RadC
MANLHAAADTAARLSEHGPSALSNEELLALVLRDATTGDLATPLARRVLAGLSLSQLAREPPRALARRSGISPLFALRIASAMELFRRVEREEAALPARISDTRAVYAWAKPRLVSLPHEELWMLALDGRNNVRASRRVCMGGRHGLAVAAPDVLRLALLEGAAGFVLVHNHPSGNPEPSAEDQRFTERVAQAAAAVDVPLFDHVVVAQGGYARVSLG